MGHVKVEILKQLRNSLLNYDKLFDIQFLFITFDYEESQEEKNLRIRDVTRMALQYEIIPGTF